MKNLVAVVTLLLLTTSQSEAAWLLWMEWYTASSSKPAQSSASIDTAFETQAECLAVWDARRDSLTQTFGGGFEQTQRTVGGIRFRGAKDGTDEKSVFSVTFSCWPVGVELVNDGLMIKARPSK
jgi:hypothetical protein